MSIDLRGRCRELAEAAVADDPSLRLVRGYYDDPTWGRQPHWWAEQPDGTVVDPTADQFPMGGVAFLYDEFDGFLACEECGKTLAESEAIALAGKFGSSLPVCSDTCFRRMVGL